MSKRYNIRWTADDEKELNRAVKNFNAKLSRIAKAEEKRAKQDPDYKKTVLPEKASVKKLRDLVTTRQDLNRELNALKRFSKKGAEIGVELPDNKHNLKITDWQKKEMNMRVGVINRKRAVRLKAIEEIEMKSGGKDLGYKVGQFGTGTEEENALRPMKAFSYSMDATALAKKYRHIQKESQSEFFNTKDQILKENYINALRESYGEEEIADIIDEIDEMSFQKFFKTFKAEGGTMEWVSKLPSDADRRAYVEQLRSQWKPNK